MAATFVCKPITIEAERCVKETFIETLEGTMKANPGDWIITGLLGEKYPCKNEVFRKKYEPLNKEAIILFNIV